MGVSLSCSSLMSDTLHCGPFRDRYGSVAFRTSAEGRETAGLPLLVAAAVRTDGIGLQASVHELFAARLAEVSEETAQVLAARAVINGVADPGDLHAASGRAEAETVDAVEEALRAGRVREEGSIAEALALDPRDAYVHTVAGIVALAAACGAHDDAVATALDALALGLRLGDRHRLAALFAEVGADPLDRPDVWTLTAW
jgi:hypothetical protein